MALNTGNSLFWKTGLDTKGLQSGALKSKGILAGLSKSITRMDVFAGLAIGSALAFAKISKQAYNFSKDFEHAMKEVMTISDATKSNFKGISAEIVEMSKTVPDNAIKLSKAFYQIVSSGQDGAKAMDTLKVSADLAVAGITDTMVAADAITYVMNSFGEAAGDAENIAGKLFMTVKLGKCLTGDTRILLSDGRYKRIDSLSNEKDLEIISWDYKNFIPMNAKYVDMGIKETVELITQNGRKIKTTPEHPYLTPNGWKRVDELSLDDKIAVPSSLPFFGNIKPQEGLAELLGYLLAEGSIYTGTPRLAINNPILVDKVKEAASSFNIRINKNKKKQGVLTGDSYDLTFNKIRGINKPNPLTEILKEYKLYGCTCYNKFIPDDVFQWKKDSIAKLLRAYFNGDGAFYKNGNKNKPQYHLSFCSVSERLVRDLSHLLIRFGINGTIRKKKTKWNYKNKTKESFAWEWTTGKYIDIKRYLDFIGIDKVDDIIEKFNKYIPSRKNNSKHLSSYGKPERDPRRFKKYSGIIFTESQIEYTKINKIKPQKEERVFDLVVPILCNFVAADIVCHNTKMEELAPAVSKVAGMWAQAGGSFVDLMASIATGVKSLPIDIMTTGIRGILAAIISPGEDAKKVLKELKIEFDANTLATKGFSHILLGMNEAVGDDVDKMEKLAAIFPNVRGLIGALALDSEKYTEALDAMSRGTKEFKEATKIMIADTTNQLAILKNNFMAKLKPLGDSLLKQMNDIAKGINIAMSGANDELSNLSRAYSDMVGTLQSKKGKLTT